MKSADVTEREKLQAAIELEELRFKRNLQIENRKGEIATSQSMMAAAASYANGALRSLLLVNGGAILSLLTFIGNSRRVGSDQTIMLPDAFVWSIRLYSIGIAAALCASSLAYISQILIMELKKGEADFYGGLVRIVAILSAVTSLIVFIMGSNAAAIAVVGRG